MGFEGLAPSASLLLAGLLLDAIFGDPQVRWHPIRLIGGTLSWFEKILRLAGLDGYAGGCALFAMLALVWVVIPGFLIRTVYLFSPASAMAVHAVVVFIFFALRDLIDHVRRVQKSARRRDLEAARKALAWFVGRDTDRTDFEACRRASIESLGEGFVDGYLSALFWYVLAGVPGLLLFKVVSTMDSIVGYKNARYLRFGWCGARLDDLMNYVPARLAWFLLCVTSLPFSGLSAGKGLRIGWRQHAVVPGPNAGWSEASMAGLLQRRLVGPVWKGGALVTEVWLGDPADPEGGSDLDVSRALRVTILAAGVAALAAVLVLL